MANTTFTATAPDWWADTTTTIGDSITATELHKLKEAMVEASKTYYGTPPTITTTTGRVPTSYSPTITWSDLNNLSPTEYARLLNELFKALDKERPQLGPLVVAALQELIKKEKELEGEIDTFTTKWTSAYTIT